MPDSITPPPVGEDNSGETPSPEDVSAVLSALSSAKYQWRTLNGVARDTELPLGKILRILGTSDEVVKSAIGRYGEDLWSTRGHLRETAPFSTRLLGVLKNRAS